jgi:CheY-like chemotaxis protein/two-component sensor histidine kinase
LAPIRTAVELIRRKANGDPALLEKARCMMERQVGQMVRLVDDLLDISRITQRKIQLRKEQVELAAVVRSALEAARPLINTQAHELTVSLSEEPVHLHGDPTRLAQVIANLLNNAAKYTEKNGRIWLTAQRQAGEVSVSVRDSGIGIAAEHLARIFEMFSQVTPALERSHGGLGIGLALVKSLVEMHGGSVEARSSGTGLGSEFIVRLPIVEASVQASQKPDDPGEKSLRENKCRILIADDLRDSVDSLAVMLRLAGHDIQTANDGVEAVQAAATFRPDVVLLDIGMPKMNGYEVARHIRQLSCGKDLLLVALTGWGQEEDKRRALEAGFDHHLTKPVEPAALEKLLAKRLGCVGRPEMMPGAERKSVAGDRGLPSGCLEQIARSGDWRLRAGYIASVSRSLAARTRAELPATRALIARLRSVAQTGQARIARGRGASGTTANSGCQRGTA